MNKNNHLINKTHTFHYIENLLNNKVNTKLFYIGKNLIKIVLLKINKIRNIYYICNYCSYVMFNLNSLIFSGQELCIRCLVLLFELHEKQAA